MEDSKRIQVLEQQLEEIKDMLRRVLQQNKEILEAYAYLQEENVALRAENEMLRQKNMKGTQKNRTRNAVDPPLLGPIFVPLSTKCQHDDESHSSQDFKWNPFVDAYTLGGI